jgi:AcrR family transcriptional regulator
VGEDPDVGPQGAKDGDSARDVEGMNARFDGSVGLRQYDRIVHRDNLALTSTVRKGAGVSGNVDRILDAMLELISTRGPEALSIRNVAAAAGVSVGAVQHHFSTRDKLLQAAMNAVEQRFMVRIRELIRDDASPESRLRSFCIEIAGLGSDDTTEVVVWTVFAARAAVDDSIRALHVAAWGRTELFLHGLIEAAMSNVADAATDTDATTADSAAFLLAVLDGIAVSRAAERSARISQERGIRILDHALRAIDISPTT